MLIKNLRALTGMPVIDAASGKRLGRVLRACVDERLTCMTGVWVLGRLGSSMYCPARLIAMLGDVAVLTNGMGKRGERGEHMHALRALDASGLLIGAIVGAYAREESLCICGLELSRGFWEDLTDGRQFVRYYTVRLPERDVVVSEEGDEDDEERMDSGNGDGRGARRVGSDDLRHDELADGAQTGARRGKRGARVQ